MKEQNRFDVKSIIKAPMLQWSKLQDDDSDYTLVKAYPTKGILFVTPDSPYFIHGRIAVKGNKEGQYPDNYLDFIDRVFGPEPNTIEVCSRHVKVDSIRTACTVDINPDVKPSVVDDATKLAKIQDNQFNRWRGDPAYHKIAAKKMYGNDLPSYIELLRAGARVIKPGGLMFLLIGPTNYQHHPPGTQRIGLVYISVIPNNETRRLQIYRKTDKFDPTDNRSIVTTALPYDDPEFVEEEMLALNIYRKLPETIEAQAQQRLF